MYYFIYTYVGSLQLCDRTARDVTMVLSNNPLLPYTCTESGAGKTQPHIFLTLTLGHLLVVPQRWVRYLLYPNDGSATCYTPNYESATCCTPTMGQLSAVPQRWVRYLLCPNDGSGICCTPTTGQLPAIIPTMSQLPAVPNNGSSICRLPNNNLG